MKPEKYKNQKKSEADGERDAIKSRAIGQKTARIEQAHGDVALFNNLHAEYKKNKAITTSTSSTRNARASVTKS